MRLSLNQRDQVNFFPFWVSASEWSLLSQFSTSKPWVDILHVLISFLQPPWDHSLLESTSPSFLLRMHYMLNPLFSPSLWCPMNTFSIPSPWGGFPHAGQILLHQFLVLEESVLFFKSHSCCCSLFHRLLNNYPCVKWVLCLLATRVSWVFLMTEKHKATENERTINACPQIQVSSSGLSCSLAYTRFLCPLEWLL